MDPCPFVWVTVGNIALKIPVASKLTHSVVHLSSSVVFLQDQAQQPPPSKRRRPLPPVGGPDP
ncbi:hypothetical protein GBA52_027634 [Prunus armeniaca]|nr:hypothetical protein GBA52_027634 [Prunus armeniaca]